MRYPCGFEEGQANQRQWAEHIGMCPHPYCERVNANMEEIRQAYHSTHPAPADDGFLPSDEPRTVKKTAKFGQRTDIIEPPRRIYNAGVMGHAPIPKYLQRQMDELQKTMDHMKNAARTAGFEL